MDWYCVYIDERRPSPDGAFSYFFSPGAAKTLEAFVKFWGGVGCPEPTNLHQMEVVICGAYPISSAALSTRKSTMSWTSLKSQTARAGYRLSLHVGHRDYGMSRLDHRRPGDAVNLVISSRPKGRAMGRTRPCKREIPTRRPLRRKCARPPHAKRWAVAIGHLRVSFSSCSSRCTRSASSNTVSAISARASRGRNGYVAHGLALAWMLFNRSRRVLVIFRRFPGAHKVEGSSTHTAVDS